MASYDYNKKYAQKYLEKQDELKIRVPKGQKATIQAAADNAGESVNQYTQGALLARMGLKEWPMLAEEDQQEEKKETS